MKICTIQEKISEKANAPIINLADWSSKKNIKKTFIITETRGPRAISKLSDKENIDISKTKEIARKSAKVKININSVLSVILKKLLKTEFNKIDTVIVPKKATNKHFLMKMTADLLSIFEITNTTWLEPKSPIVVKIVAAKIEFPNLSC
jgi:hypothetical protein